MQIEDEERLRHMLDAATEVIGFAKGKTRANLDSDRLLTLGLMKGVEIIGEAAFKMTPTAKTEHPQIPWANIIGIRHRLVHAYFDIELDVLWNTIEEDLPPLIAELKKAIPS